MTSENFTANFFQVAYEILKKKKKTFKQASFRPFISFVLFRTSITLDTLRHCTKACYKEKNTMHENLAANDLRAF